MAILPKNLDFTSKDFDSLNARMNNLLVQAFPTWSDVQASNFGNALKELFAFTGDVTLFYQDNQAKESRLTDVDQRKNAIALAEHVGFEPPGATASTATVLITLDSIPANDVVFPSATLMRTKDVVNPVEFQLLSVVTIPASADPPQALVVVENSTNVDDEFVSSGLVDQEFQLTGVPFLDGSAVIIAANGPYTVEDSFQSSDSTDLHATIAVDENDRATVRFGSGVNGTIPIGIITVDYKIGGGEVGNVDSNTIQVIPGSFTDVLGNPHLVTVNNADKASGGTNRTTVAQIKEQAPQHAKLLTRTVATSDYVAGAESVPGVARALFLTADQAPGLPENRGFIYPVPVGGGAPTQVLKDAVLTAVTITRENTTTHRVEVKDPVYKTMNIGATIYLTETADAAITAAAVRSNLATFFSILNADGSINEDIGFGFAGKNADGTPAREIPLLGTLISGVISDNTGVRKVGARDQDFTINGTHDDEALELFEFPVLGTVSLLDGDTGASL